jgi:N-acetylglucosamine-6-sulfatase
LRSGKVWATLLLFAVLIVRIPSASADEVMVAGVSPTIGYIGTTLSIDGSDLDQVTGVSFGDRPADYAIESSERLLTSVPSGSTSGPITLTSAVGVTMTPDPFTVQPNIVVIVTDDQRWDALVFPTIQGQLMSKGMTFSNAFAVNPVCCPSRVSMLTGKYSHSSDIYKNLPPHGGFDTFRANGGDRSTVATWLHDVGYRTAMIGKYLNGYGLGDTSYVPPGWDTWNALALAPLTGGDDGGYFNYSMSMDGLLTTRGSAPEDYSTDVLAGLAEDFIARAPSDQPLFLYLAPRAPHTPTTPAARHARAFSTLPPLTTPSVNEEDVSDKPAWVRALPSLTASQITAQQNHRKRQYRTMLAVDDALARVLASLDVTGRLQDSMIIFTSDNGYAFGEHRWSGKEVPWEESIRLPFIVRYDALQEGGSSSSSELVLNVDIAPTLASFAGTVAPGVDGQSVAPILEGSFSEWRDDILLEHARTNIGKVSVPAYCGVRTTSHKYVRYSSGEEELYDLIADPFELSNLAADPLLTELKASLRRRAAELCTPTPPGYGSF